MREALLERMPPMEVIRQNSDDSPLSYDIEESEQQNDSPVHQTDSVSYIPSKLVVTICYRVPINQLG